MSERRLTAAPRIERVEFEGRPAWRKRHVGTERPWLVALLRGAARALRVAPLIPPPALSAQQACATELAMLRRLQELQVRVPEVLAIEHTTLVLSDLGTTLSTLCKRTKSLDEREWLVATGFAALADLHRRGGYLSQAFVRNLAMHDGQVGFLDLEEDPLRSMPLPAAQARDLLLYLYSVARLFVAEPQRLSGLLDRHMQCEAVEVVAMVRDSARRLRWLTGLLQLGPRRARVLGEALRHLAAQLPAPA